MRKIELNDVSRAYGRTYAVYRVSHTFEAGKCYAILGGNGAGKSTLLNMLATLEVPTQGVIRYDGIDSVRFVLKGRYSIGWLTHDSMVYPELTGRENLLFFARMYGLEDPLQRVEIWLRRVNLEEASDMRAASYSRGMIQRLSIARALIHAPKLVLLDEPFTGLDQESKHEMAKIFSKLRDKGCIVIMITHDFAIDSCLFNEVIRMRDGELVSVVPIDPTEEGAVPSLLEIYEGRR